jgi:hypothetical protein
VSAPKSTTAPLAYVYDGRQCLGHVLGRGPIGFEAFDRDDKSLDLFETARQAASALVVEEGGA